MDTLVLEIQVLVARFVHAVIFQLRQNFEDDMISTLCKHTAS